MQDQVKGMADVGKEAVRALAPSDLFVVIVLIAAFVVILWQMRIYVTDRRSYWGQLVELTKNVTQVIDRNTEAIHAMHTVGTDTRALIQDLKDQLLSHPCLLMTDEGMRRSWEALMRRKERDR